MKHWVAIIGMVLLVVLIGGGVTGWFLVLAPQREVEVREAKKAAEEKMWRVQYMPLLREVDFQATRGFNSYAVPLLKSPQKLAGAKERDSAKNLFGKIRDDVEDASAVFAKPSPFTEPELVKTHQDVAAYMVAWKKCYQDLMSALDQPKGPDRKMADALLQQHQDIMARIAKLRENRHVSRQP